MVFIKTFLGVEEPKPWHTTKTQTGSGSDHEIVLWGVGTRRSALRMVHISARMDVQTKDSSTTSVDICHEIVYG